MNNPIPSGSNPKSSESAPTLKILLAEDSEDVRDVMVQILTRAGHTVRAVENGLLALAQIELFQPDLIVSDIAMPELNGVEMGIALRDAKVSTPILYVSSSTEDPAYAGRIEQIGNTYVLRKPVRLPDLLKKINEILKPAA